MLSTSSIKLVTETSVCVADGGRESRTVRKVSWNKTACQSLRRCCFSNSEAWGTTMLGSRCNPIAYACRIRIPANAHPSLAWLEFIRKYVISTID